MKYWFTILATKDKPASIDNVEVMEIEISIVVLLAIIYLWIA